MAFTIDFETRSKVDLRKVGAHAYAEHPSTEVLCLAWAEEGDKEPRLWSPLRPIAEDEKVLTEFLDKVREGCALVAYNAAFERWIWNLVCVRRHGWPAIQEGQLTCSMAQAQAHALPGALDLAASAMDLPFRKDDGGHRLMLAMSKPAKPTVANPNRMWRETDEDLERLFAYCRQDVRVEQALAQSLRPLSRHERGVWALDQEINQRGIPIDVQGVKAALRIYKRELRVASARLAEITDGEVESTTRREAFLTWSRNQGWPIPDTQSATLDAWLSQDLDAKRREAYAIWRGANRATPRKYTAMLERASADGRIRGALRYHAASTGRWSSVGVQVQNLTSRQDMKDMDDAWARIHTDDLPEKPGPFDFLAGAIRGAICAPPGREFLVGDYASIEARIVFWLANETEALHELETGGDIYVTMASRIYNVSPKAVTPPQRKLGKQAVLGLGYQMGAPKFQTTCAGYGIEVSDAEAERIKTVYRDTYWRVTRLWAALQETAQNAVMRGNGAKAIECCRTLWGIRGRFLHCRLPSGRLLSYLDPKIVAGPFSDVVEYSGIDTYTRKFGRVKTYGGKLCENVTQATARDIMAEAMLRLNSSRYPVILTVHDEVVSEVGEAEGTIEEFKEIMAIRPEWAKSLPIAVEAWRGQRYKK
jgi:DNA polymerase bacteriophage-type